MAQGSGGDSARRPGRSGFGTSSCSGAYGISGLLHGMAAELVAQGGLDLGRERFLLPRRDATEKRKGDDGRRDVLIDGRLHRPAAFSAVLDVAFDPL